MLFKNKKRPSYNPWVEVLIYNSKLRCVGKKLIDVHSIESIQRTNKIEDHVYKSYGEIKYKYSDYTEIIDPVGYDDIKDKLTEEGY